MVAEAALSAGVVVTGLHAESDDLESRFLAATAGAQEYRTDDADLYADRPENKK